MTNHLQLAREHLAAGEEALSEARNQITGLVAGGTVLASFSALATAHFTASMAHTNLLLADPSETPELAEQ